MKPIKPLNPHECQKLTRLWKNFETVIGRLPMSDTAALLAFHCQNALDALAKPTVEGPTLASITERVNTLVNQSPIELDIEDVLAPLKEAIGLN